MRVKAPRAGSCLILAALAVPAAGAAPDERRPEAEAGPYRLVVDRITQTTQARVTYRSDDGKGGGSSTRTVQLQLSIFGRDPETTRRLAVFQLETLSVGAGKGYVELPHFGGILDAAANGAVRVFTGAPNVPLAAEEIGLAGQLVAYEKSGPVELEIPLSADRFPMRTESEGVIITVNELDTAAEGAARLHLSLEASPETFLQSIGATAPYGVSLLDVEGRPATPIEGSLARPAGGRLEYRVRFKNVRAKPAALRVRVVRRGGRQFTYPFRLQRLPIPRRREGSPVAERP